MVALPMLFQHSVFALEAAFGGGEIAGNEVVVFDFARIPGGHGRSAVGEKEVIVFALDAEALPFGLGGFEHEIVEEGTTVPNLVE